jgi:hypothetical protein
MFFRESLLHHILIGLSRLEKIIEIDERGMR